MSGFDIVEPTVPGELWTIVAPAVNPVDRNSPARRVVVATAGSKEEAEMIAGIMNKG